MIIDLTPVRDGTGPARLLDMVEGRSKQAFTSWLSGRPQDWRDAVEVVAMDGFTGFRTAAAEQLPDAVAVMDPFHVVRLAGDALDACRRRVQQHLHGDRGRTGDPLYASRRTLHTVDDLLTDRQRERAAAVRVAVGGDHPLVDAPGRLDLDVLLGGEQGGEDARRCRASSTPCAPESRPR